MNLNFATMVLSERPHTDGLWYARKFPHRPAAIAIRTNQLNGLHLHESATYLTPYGVMTPNFVNIVRGKHVSPIRHVNHWRLIDLLGTPW